MNGAQRLLLGGMAAILVVLEIKALAQVVLIAPRFAVDLEIPLRAAERWLAGDPPYLASAFASPPGATQPFLYPPYTLPFFAPLTSLPRALVGGLGVSILLATAVAACRRLDIPWVWMPIVLAWPPFAEAIYGANIQVAMFAALVFLFYRAGNAAEPPIGRDVSSPSEHAAFVGGLAIAIGAVKVSQPHTALFVLRYRPMAAIAGGIAVLILAAATLPLVGIDAWFDWANVLKLAGDPAWDLGGYALPRFLPPGVGLAIAGACLVAVWFVPRRDPAPWIGLLSVVGALSLHIFGLLFLVPALLRIRREAALLAAICIATYSYEGSWAGILICLTVFVAGQRWPALLEPIRRQG
jgi:Glycosyltransferase family 87